MSKIDNPLYKRFVPITRVVNAALIDTYGDVTKSKEIYMHWAARGLKALQKQVIKTGKRRILLDVNKSFMSATLPPDFLEENLQFVGYIDHRGYKIGLGVEDRLTNDKSIETIECEDTCPKCKQDKGICNDLTVTESTEVVIINDASYTKTIIKKLYPDGNYFLETTTPYYNTVTEAVEYATTKEFITELDLTVCGCIEDSESNKQKIKSCCSSVYDSYYSEYGGCDSDMGGYKVFPEIGILQLDRRYRYEQVYLEYVGCMLKINGEYAIPEVAFETLVAWIKYKAVANKDNVPLSTKQFYFQDYMRERNNMEKIMSRVSLSSIIDIMNQAPKLEIDMGNLYGYGYYDTRTGYTGVTKINKEVSESVCEANQASCNTSNGTKHLTPFQLAVIAGNGSGTPVADSFTYTNAGLIGAVNINEISVNKNLETTLAGDFTFNSETGTITRINPWFAGDTLIIGFAKLV